MNKASSNPAELPAGVFARASTCEQIGARLTSCEAQVTVCRNFVAQHARDERRLKEAIAAGRIKVVYKIERLLRATEAGNQKSE